MSKPTKWYAQYQFAGASLLEPMHTLLAVMPCTVDVPQLIPGWKMVARPRLTMAAAYDDVIDFLRANKRTLEFGTLDPAQAEKQILDTLKGK